MYLSLSLLLLLSSTAAVAIPIEAVSGNPPAFPPGSVCGVAVIVDDLLYSGRWGGSQANALSGIKALFKEANAVFERRGRPVLPEGRKVKFHFDQIVHSKGTNNFFVKKNLFFEIFLNMRLPNFLLLHKPSAGADSNNILYCSRSNPEELLCPKAEARGVINARSALDQVTTFIQSWNLEKYCLVYLFSGQRLGDGAMANMGGACAKPVSNSTSNSSSSPSLSGAGLISFAGVEGNGKDEGNVALGSRIARGFAQSLGATNGE